MALLKKFEEGYQQSASGASESDDEEDDGGDDLVERFQDMDLESASAANVWSKLTPAEREKFLKLMENPSTGLAQQLLASEELENERREPWWDVPSVEQEVLPKHRYGTKPEPIRVPADMVKPIGNGPMLFCNMCALCIAYAFTSRHLSVSPLSSLKPDDIDLEEARSIISQLVPFLTDPKSATVYSNVSGIVTDIWSRFKPDQINSALFALLLRDTVNLLRPLPITALPSESESPSISRDTFDTSSHPHLNSILVLSDLSHLFGLRANGTWKPNPTTRKLLFYAAHILSTPSPILLALSGELLATAVSHDVRGKDDAAAANAESSEIAPGWNTHEGPRKAVIEEILQDHKEYPRGGDLADNPITS
ncbi:hypothetical protein DXG03_007761 [Asterophora parasitica]|uniref:Uncharacterized protein n=1 Tax=Asterophora parasitica TaxID=117018 RepID=A0A9P7GC49_9AGAR|nr:hypothetical protein DXG03_007761 [Asterophora parasitica]